MTVQTSLTGDSTRDALKRLSAANARFAVTYPGESGARQPIHTVYGGAHLFAADSAGKLGALALRAMGEYAPDAATFAAAVGIEGAHTPLVYERVLAKLRREPVEDFRVDFEDGYGSRPDAEEDGHAERAAKEVARGIEAGTLPPFLGIRIKPWSAELAARSLRTLDVFVTTLAAEAGPKLVKGALAGGRSFFDSFVVTLPKVQIPEQTAALAEVLALLEAKLSWPKGTIRIEIMIETPQSILDQDGRSTLLSLARAGDGRCTGAHLGTYDYTASCNITAAHQHMEHPACDFAKQMMQVAYAGSGLHLSDGATNVMPVGPHKAPKGGALTPDQAKENAAAVHRAWKLHAHNIRHSLVNGFYQGWDLHPAQLPSRYAAVYSFFLEGRDAASARLRNFLEKAAQATLVGDVFDDAATGQGLLNSFLRGIGCGAITEGEAVAAGVTLEELQTRSFVKILAARKERAR